MNNGSINTLAHHTFPITKTSTEIKQLIFGVVPGMKCKNDLAAYLQTTYKVIQS